MTKTAIVTGASSGIGYATAELLAQRGYEVHGTFNQRKDEAETLANKYSNLSFHQADFSIPNGVEKLLSEVKGMQFDVLVNNAGIVEADGFDDWDYGVWSTVLSVNLDAPTRLTMGLRDQINDGGSVVNVSSSDGLTGSFTSMAYSASKAALINLTKSLGNNFGPRNIRVNAVAPGWVDTGMSTPESMEAPSMTPMRRNGTGEDVAQLIAFLVSDEASFINGETVVIDGGLRNVDYFLLRESQGSHS